MNQRSRGKSRSSKKTSSRTKAKTSTLPEGRLWSFKEYWPWFLAIALPLIILLDLLLAGNNLDVFASLWGVELLLAVAAAWLWYFKQRYRDASEPEQQKK